MRTVLTSYGEWIIEVLRCCADLGLDVEACRRAGKALNGEAREMFSMGVSPIAAAQALFVWRVGVTPTVNAVGSA